MCFDVDDTTRDISNEINTDFFLPKRKMQTWKNFLLSFFFFGAMDRLWFIVALPMPSI